MRHMGKKESLIEQPNSFIIEEIKKLNFVKSILFAIIGYVLITLWLNSIRVTAPIFFVWVLIVVQLGLYFSIFSISYMRAKERGFKRFSFIFFLTLTFLGRVENWELFIIPLLFISMLIVSNTDKIYKKG